MKYCFDLNLFFSVLAKSLIFSPEVVLIRMERRVKGRGGGMETTSTQKLSTQILLFPPRTTRLTLVPNLKRPPISPHCLVIHFLPLLISPLSTRLPLFSEKLSPATIKYRAAGKKKIAAPLPFCHIFEQLRIDFEINPGRASRRGCGREAASGGERA